MLNAGARYHTRREGLAFNDDGRFRNYRFYVQGSQPTSIQRGAEFGKAAIRVAEIAMAEIVFPAEVQAQISAHPRALSLQESHQASDMVVVAVADNERIHLGDIDLENFEVVRVNAGREAEVEQEATAFLALAGLDMQRQPPLAFQGPALLCRRKSHAADRETGRLGSPKGDIVRVIGDLPDNDLVNDRHLDPDWSSKGRPIKWYAACQQRTTKHGRVLQKSTAIQRARHVRSPHVYYFSSREVGRHIEFERKGVPLNKPTRVSSYFPTTE